jgi:hypothetical protein
MGAEAKTYLVVDVSNATWVLPSKSYQQLLTILEALRVRFPPDPEILLVADANYLHMQREMGTKADEAAARNDQRAGKLILVPSRTLADELIIQLAQDHNGFIITNDEYQDHYDAYPWLLKAQPVFGVLIQLDRWYFLRRKLIKREKTGRFGASVESPSTAPSATDTTSAKAESGLPVSPGGSAPTGSPGSQTVLGTATRPSTISAGRDPAHRPSEGTGEGAAESTHLERGTQPSARSYVLLGEQYDNAELLAEGFVLRWDEARTILEGRGNARVSVEYRLLAEFFERGGRRDLAQLLGRVPSDNHGLATLIAAMNPLMPPMFRGRYVTPQGLLDLCAEAMSAADPAASTAGTILTELCRDGVLTAYHALPGCEKHATIDEVWRRSTGEWARWAASTAQAELTTPVTLARANAAILSSLLDSSFAREMAESAVRARGNRRSVRQFWFRRLVTESLLSPELRPAWDTLVNEAALIAADQTDREEAAQRYAEQAVLRRQREQEEAQRRAEEAARMSQRESALTLEMIADQLAKTLQLAARQSKTEPNQGADSAVVIANAQAIVRLLRLASELVLNQDSFAEVVPSDVSALMSMLPVGSARFMSLSNQATATADRLYSEAEQRVVYYERVVAPAIEPRPQHPPLNNAAQSFRDRRILACIAFVVGTLTFLWEMSYYRSDITSDNVMGGLLRGLFGLAIIVISIFVIAGHAMDDVGRRAVESEESSVRRYESAMAKYRAAQRELDEAEQRCQASLAEARTARDVAQRIAATLVTISELAARAAAELTPVFAERLLADLTTGELPRSAPYS